LIDPNASVVGVAVGATGANVGVLVGMLTGASVVAVAVGKLAACVDWQAATNSIAHNISNTIRKLRNMINLLLSRIAYS
jgi:endonuclease V-like protein UPF0215 family